MRKSFVLIAVIICINCTGAIALAESYNVTATVPAPLPTTVPLVTGPTTTTQASSGVYVSGTCEILVPTLLVVLIRDTQTIGSGNCLPNGTFRIFVGLVLGVNTIYPKFLTITGDSSGFGAPITLVYQMNADDTGQSGDKTAISNAKDADEGLGAGIDIILDYDFISYSDDKPLQIKYRIFGGKPPYTVTIAWGDSSQKKYTIASAGDQEVSHVYKNILPPSQLTIQATDSNGYKTYESRALVSFRKGVYIPPSQPEALEQKRDYSTLAAASLGVGAVVFLAAVATNSVAVSGGSSQSLARTKARRSKK